MLGDMLKSDEKIYTALAAVLQMLAKSQQSVSTNTEKRVSLRICIDEKELWRWAGVLTFKSFV